MRYYTKEHLEAQLDTAMGGRIAEELFFGNKNITTGCGSDLNNATKSSYGAVFNYGMVDSYSVYDPDNVSDKMKGELDSKISTMLYVS